MNEVGTGLSLQEAQSLARPRTLTPLQQELMSWYHRLYHLPFRILFYLTSMVFLPNWLLECLNKPPLCVDCQSGASHHHPWQTKGKKSGLIRIPEKTNPADGVLVYYIVSAQPVLIPQMSGFPTSQSFLGCTIFVDRVSEYVYVYLMRDLSLSEMLLAKEALEKLMAQSGRTVKHYQFDNGRYAGNGFVDSVNPKYQKMNFCWVGATNHNVIVENNINILTTGARTLLLHGMKMWPQMIDKMFWEFDMKSIAERLNSL